MATRLTLVCHAATTATRLVSFPGNDALEDGALRQISAVARRLSGHERCWTSPARCALQTAAALRLDACVEPVLRDVDHGRWTGHSLAAIEAAEPEALLSWLQDPAATPHGGESILAMMARVQNWLDVQRDIPGRFVAVTHPAVIRAAIVHAIEATPRSFWRIDVAPLSVTTLHTSHGRYTLSSIGKP